MFERMEKKTGIKITAHASKILCKYRWEADWPLEMISQALGHKHLDTTIRYLNVLDDKLKTASQELPPIFQTLRSRTVFEAGGRMMPAEVFAWEPEEQWTSSEEREEDRRTEPGIR